MQTLLPLLYSTAKRLTRSSADAEDLVAESVGRAWEHRKALRERTAFRGWLFRIMTNTFLEQRRSARSRPAEDSLDDISDGDSFSLFERLHQPILLWWGNPEREFLDRMVRADFDKALRSLPEQMRLVVLLADVDGLSYEEIAETLAIPIGTVRSRLSRGRSLLQRALWEHAVDAGIVPAGGRKRRESAP